MDGTLDNLYGQLMGAMPASPYASPQLSADLGLPYPTSLMSEMPGSSPLAPSGMPASALPDATLGMTPAFGAATTAGDQFGYSPQPRPPLPAPIADEANGLYGPFRAVWDQMQQEPDPLAALMAQMPDTSGMPGFPPAATPAGPMVPDRPFSLTMPDQGYGVGPSPGERMLAQRGYGRVLDRLNWLRGLRAQRGY